MAIQRLTHPFALVVFVAAEAAIVVIAASALGSLEASVTPMWAVCWIVLVAAVAIGRRWAWLLLSGLTLLGGVSFTLFAASRAASADVILIIAFLMAQGLALASLMPRRDA